MPGYKGHFFGALLFFVIILAGLLFFQCSASWKICAQGLFFTILGALFPDIDTKSQGQKLFYAVLCIVLISLICYKKYLLGITIALLGFIPLFSRHRGLFHSFWFAAVLVSVCISVIVLQFPLYTALAIHNGVFFLVGVYSHLVLDFGLRRALRRR